MKQLVCEMCGSTDLIKQEGVFVCQSCGCKYSVEEAKKMMVDGTVQVEGAVQIDNSNMIEQWMAMADNAIDSGNYKEAYGYYTRVVEVDPENWRAIFGKGKSAAWQSTLSNIRTSELYQAVNQALAIVETVSDPESFVTIKNEFCMEIFNFNNAITDLMHSNVPEDADDRWPEHIDLVYDSLRRHLFNAKQLKSILPMIESYEDPVSIFNISAIKRRICTDIKAGCRDLCCHKDYSDYNVSWYGLDPEEREECLDIFEELMYEFRQHSPRFGTTIDELPLPEHSWVYDHNEEVIKYWEDRYSARKRAIERAKELKIQAEKKQARDKYWANHAEEKAKLEKRYFEIGHLLISLKEQRDLLNKQKNKLNNQKAQKVPAEKEKYTLSLKIDSLKKEYETLGIFSRRRKKEIQAELDSLNVERENLEKLSSEQRTQMQREIQSEIKKIDEQLAPINTQIESLKAEEKSIVDELNKDR